MSSFSGPIFGAQFRHVLAVGLSTDERMGFTNFWKAVVYNRAVLLDAGVRS